MEMDLSQRISLVTGAGRGIGRACALALAAAGSKVVVADLNGYDEVAAEISGKGGLAMGLRADISSVEDIKMVFASIEAKWGGLDVLVNNAGICTTSSVDDITESEWDLVLSVNLKGAFFCSQAAAGLMEKRGGGRIINIASLAGRTGSAVASTTYSVSKAGVIGLTRDLARKLAPLNINVNCIAPGPLESHIVGNIFGEENKQKILQTIPLGRIGQQEEIARWVLFLASSSDYATGAVFDINGGMFIG